MNDYSVYRLTSPDGLVYIGATRQALNRRWHRGHAYQNNDALWTDIQLYGWDYFQKDVVAKGLSAEEAFKLEKDLIEQYGSTNPERGYNRSTGGPFGRSGCPSDEDTKAKISKALSGKRKGIPHTETHRQNISRALKGHHTSAEVRQKLRVALGSRLKSPEARAKQKASTPRGSAHHKAKGVVCVSSGKEYPTIADAAAQNQVSRNGIAKCCAGQQKMAGGLIWKWKEN